MGEINIHVIHKDIQRKIYGWTRNRTWDPCITIVRCSTTELSRMISTVYLTCTTSFLPLSKSSPSKTHTTNTSSSCQDLLTNARSMEGIAPNKVGMERKNTYKDIQMKYMYKAGLGIKPGTLASIVRCYTSELAILFDIHGSFIDKS